ncbi:MULTISPECIES: hypothetical protein [unclassified Bradyrhizobium]|uniref:hypothetical protein n=1 Tax=unclassified Bradyrhizobium TaxID=2631580 RepID=UPI0029161415|nr:MULTISPECIES: hypothetical protein [unclassified Bradyrhizobium]
MLAVLGTINLVLGAKLVILGLGEETVGSQRAAWNAELPRSMASHVERPRTDAYTEIVAHPIFSKSREPFVPLPPAPPLPVPPQQAVTADPGFIVGGIMITGRASKAYLLSKAGGGVGSWVDEKGTFQGWTVKTIDASGVRIEQVGRTIELQLYPRN